MIGQPSDDSLSRPTADDIAAAAARLNGRVHRTPVMTSRALNQLVGTGVWLKCENFQRSGSFKIRGAMNTVMSLDAEAAARGIVTHSSGNHAAAVALAARERGVPAHVVVPNDAPVVKIAAARRYGANLHLCPPGLDAREAAVRGLLEQTGGHLVHPYDDPRVIAGQGTCAREFLADVPSLATIVAPVSGGGLMSGTCIAAASAGVRLVGCEPALADDAARSLASGRLQRNTSQETIADGLRASLSPRTFAILREHLDGGIATVGEDEIIEAMRLVWQIFKIVIEPSCAVPVAAMLGGAIDHGGRPVGIIISGGNVDLDALPWK
jgi:threonine dehydratase